MQRLFLLILPLTLYYHCKSQSVQRHEIGFNTLAIIQTKPSTAAIYRYKRANLGIRVLAGAYLDNGFSSDMTEIKTTTGATAVSHKHTNYMLTGVRLSIGIQKRFFVQEKWFLYKGIDAGYENLYEQKGITTKLPNGFGNLREEKDFENLFQQFNLSPILGLTMQMLPHFSISAEAGLPICRYLSSSDEVSKSFVTDNLGVERLNATGTVTDQTNGWKLDLNNQAFRVFLSVQF
jgi:hypothetical protein